MLKNCAEKCLNFSRRSEVFVISSQVRWKSSAKLKKQKSSVYKETLLMPRTDFPLTMTGVLERERKVREEFDHDSLYDWQRSQRRHELFVLHDGPPYANGSPHVGHALNKILKDIALRWKLLRGCKVHYVPGWDCHGLPIELKALQGAAAPSSVSDPISIRDCAKSFASKAIEEQRRAFKSWNLVADWTDEGCYRSFDSEYEVSQLDVFYAMYMRGCVYQSFMPIYWSPSSQSALAESELEYNDDHRSIAIYLSIPLMCDHGELNALVWTTTPWTIPANRGICFNPKMKYVVVEMEDDVAAYLLAENCVDNVADALGRRVKTLRLMENLDKLSYVHPLVMTSDPLPFLPSSHVHDTKGTGLVHAAPAHGHDDFHVFRAHNLSVERPWVDNLGRFTREAGPELEGLEVLGDGNGKVLKMLGNNVLHQKEYIHSYPYDWRTKQPVIILASLQWFVDNRSITVEALKALESVNFFPDPTKGSEMAEKLRQRNYWCISRQRVWGLPIPVFYDKKSREPLINDFTVRHLKDLFRNNAGGSDCWWRLPLETLLPDGVLSASGLGDRSSKDFVRGDDILDIWFDSGSSWNSVVKRETGCHMSNLYLEGLDQYGGWFLSSLLTCVAVHGEAPFKNILVHGFVVDEEGRKMSKSKGNVVDPQELIFGKKNEEGAGVDVLRLWVASSAERKSVIKLGPNVVGQNYDRVFRMRKTLRFVLGNLFDFDPSVHSLPAKNLRILDQAILLQLKTFLGEVETAFESFSFATATSRIRDFVETVSSLYLDPVRDRLYCDAADSAGRRAAQTTLSHLLDGLLPALAPILPHLADELFSHRRPTPSTSIMKTNWGDAVSFDFSGVDEVLVEGAFRDGLALRKYLLRRLEEALDKPTVSALEMKTFLLRVEIDKEVTPEFIEFSAELLGCARLEITGVSSADAWKLPRLPPIKKVITVDNEDEDLDADALERTEIEILHPHFEDGTEFRFVAEKTQCLSCLRCRLYNVEEQDSICDRCRKVLSDFDSIQSARI